MSVFGIILALSGILLFVLYYTGKDKREAMTARVDGTVTFCEQTFFATDETSSDEYEVSLTYVVDGKEYERNRVQVARSYDIGDRIELAYDPADPSGAELATSVEDAFVMLICGGVLIVAGIAVFVFGKRPQVN